MAHKAAKVEAGTPEGDVIATLGIATSVFVSVTIIGIFTLVGASVIPLLPKFIIASFKFIVPAVFGAVYVELASKDYKLGLIIIILAGRSSCFCAEAGDSGLEFDGCRDRRRNCCRTDQISNNQITK